MRVLLCCGLLLCLLCGCQGSGGVADDFAAARKAQAERNWGQAERLLQRFLRYEQEDQDRRWEAWQALIEVVNADTREERDTLEYLEVMLVEFADDDARTRSILEQMGQLNERLGRYGKAADAWSTYLDLGGLSAAQMAAAYRHLAAVQVRQRHFEGAEETLGQCLALPLSENGVQFCMFDLADMQAAQQNWDAAANLARQLLETSPGKELQGQTAFLLGDALEQLGRLPEAMTYFEQAKESYPNPLVVENRIVVLRKKMKKQ